MKIIDISIPVYDNMKTWPGVKPVEMKTMADKDFRTTRINISTHTGTHVDYPSHMTTSDAPAPESRLFWGNIYLATPLEQDDQRQEVTKLPLLPDEVDGVIVRTGHAAIRGTDEEFDKFYGLSLDVVNELIKQGVELIAIDSPSIESMASINENVEVHTTVLGSNTLVMENLDLRGVEDGLYELVVLPVKFEAVDGAPARAVLRKI